MRSLICKLFKHKWGDPLIAENPTKRNPGLVARECSRCHVIQVATPTQNKDGHAVITGWRYLED